MTDDTTRPPAAPETIEKLADGAMAAYAMLAGMQLDLFTALEDGPKPASEIASQIDADPGKLKLLLYALVVAGLLTVDGELFSNTAESNQFLVKGRPTYIGARHAAFSARWQDAFMTAESVRTGQAQAKLEFGAMTEDDLEVFLRGLNPQAAASGRTLAQNFDFSTYERMLEVGAGLGGVTLAVADAFPHIQAVLADFPAVVSIAGKVIDEAGLSGRVSTIQADATVDPLGGPFDVAVMRAFIQVLDHEGAQLALDNIANSLRAGGDIYVIGRVVDDTRLVPAQAALFNVTFLNVYDGGQAYTESEYRSWLEKAGFKDFKIMSVPSGDSIISARKSLE